MTKRLEELRRIHALARTQIGEATRSAKKSSALLASERRALEETEARLRQLKENVARARAANDEDQAQLETAEALRDSVAKLIRHDETRMALAQLDARLSELAEKEGAEAELELLRNKRDATQADLLEDETLEETEAQMLESHASITRREEQARIAAEANRVESELAKATRRRERAEQAARRAATDQNDARDVAAALARELVALKDKLRERPAS